MNLELNAESLPIEIREVSNLLTCLGDPLKFRMVARVDPAPGDSIERLDRMWEKAVYSRRMKALLIKRESTLIAIYASGIITLTRLENEDRGREILAEVVAKINNAFREKEHVSDRHIRSRRCIDPMELISYLPRTNCAQCGAKSCFSFATGLAYSEVLLEKCIPLQDELFSAKREALKRLLGLDHVVS